MSRTRLLVVGGVLVLGAVISLVFVLGTDADSGSPDPAATAGTPRRAGDQPITPDGDRPTLPVVTGVPRGTHAAASEPPTETIINGVRVRDHRRPEDRVPMDLPPNLHPPSSRRIQSTLTGALSEQVRQVMSSCAASVPKEAIGTKPRLEGQIVIAIQGEKATVTSAVTQLRNVTGQAADDAKACIEQKSVGVSAAAPGEADLESYSINLSFAFP